MQSLRSLAVNSPDVIVRHDKSGRCVNVTPGFERVNGLSAQDVLSKTPFEVSTRLRQTAPDFMPTLMDAMETGVPTRVELEMDREGRLEWWLVCVIPERDADGAVMSAITMWSDTSESHAMQAAMRASEQEFRSLAENSPDIIMRWDLDCRCNYVNAAFERETGIPASEALGLGVDADRLGYISISEYKVRAQKVMESREPADLVLPYLRPGDGVAVRLALRIVPEFNAEGRISGVLSVGRNITGLLNGDQRLEGSGWKQRPLSGRCNMVYEDERRSISRELHDGVGQQLSALRFGLNLLDFQFGDEQPDIREATARMVDLVDQTIRVTRDVSSSLRPAVLDMGIVPALEWLTDEFSRRTGIACNLKVPKGDLEMCEEQGITLFRIVEGSLTNSARHSEAELVEVAIQCEPACFVLEVKDNGVGFDAGRSHKPKSFGLVGIRERALKVGGDVSISSVPGVGTVVRVWIPTMMVSKGES